jgi:hypothetical protein
VSQEEIPISLDVNGIYDPNVEGDHFEFHLHIQYTPGGNSNIMECYSMYDPIVEGDSVRIAPTYTGCPRRKFQYHGMLTVFMILTLKVISSNFTYIYRLPQEKI